MSTREGPHDGWSWILQSSPLAGYSRATDIQSDLGTILWLLSLCEYSRGTFEA